MTVEPDANTAHPTTRVVWESGLVSRSLRASRLQMRGATFWFTGLSGSGKSTITIALERQLVEEGIAAYRVDGDNLRHGLCRDLGFSEGDRAINIARAGYASCLLADAGVVVLASLVSPFRRDRDQVRALHASQGIPFVEVHVAVPLEVAEQRDPKGLYRKARAGEIPNFTGIHQAYEEPIAPELVLETATMSIAQCVEQVRALVRTMS